MMSDDKYPRSEGGLWLNDRKTAENHPSVTGHLQISPEQLKILVTLHRGGVAPEKIKLQLAAWTRTISQGENKGDKFQYLRANAYYPEEYNHLFEEGAQPEAETKAPAPKPDADPDDDFPF